MSDELHFRRAQPNDAEAIAALVNSGYRGEPSRAGWTTEADYLVGRRTDAAEVINLIGGPDSLILLGERDGELVGPELVCSAHLQRDRDGVQLSMLVVKPAWQARGIGKRLLLAAEHCARTTWGSLVLHMNVITLREELIAYYTRRGYRRTDIFKPFPIEDTRSTALVDDLRFEMLTKQL